MALQAPPVAAPAVLTPLPVLESPGFEQRWAAWQAKGVAHDRAVRRKLMLALPIVLAVIAYVLLAR